jgi:hypothetical protein
MLVDMNAVAQCIVVSSLALRPSPHKSWCSGLTKAACGVIKTSATADQERYAAQSSVGTLLAALV